jgi:hypothetical protein
VTEEATRAAAEASGASLQTLVRHAALYREMAEALIARGRDRDRKVWIFEREVLERWALATERVAKTDGSTPRL